jgi:hypothetical protein
MTKSTKIISKRVTVMPMIGSARTNNSRASVDHGGVKVGDMGARAACGTGC